MDVKVQYFHWKYTLESELAPRYLGKKLVLFGDLIEHLVCLYSWLQISP